MPTLTPDDPIELILDEMDGPKGVGTPLDVIRDSDDFSLEPDDRPSLEADPSERPFERPDSSSPPPGAGLPPSEPALPPAPTRGPGQGLRNHKPGCQCFGCTGKGRPRPRKTEALAGGTGAGGGPLDASPRPAAELALPPLKTFKRTARARVGDWIKARALEPGITDIEVARRMGISPTSLKSHISKATKEGWLQFDDPLADLEYTIIPKVTENLKLFLDARDKQVTIETAKGTIFKQFQDSKGISDAPQTVLALKIEQPEGAAQIVTGKIVGRGKSFD